MQFAELSEASGTSAASIKYYRREGLLPAGRRVTATRQEYGRRHLERLQLIQVLREVAQAPIPRIRALTMILDDPTQGLLPALREAQLIALGVARTPTAPAEQEHPAIGALLERMGWPDVPSAPRAALDEVLRAMSAWEGPDETDVLLRYAEPVACIAAMDVAWMRDLPRQTADQTEEEPSDDVLVMRSVAGAVARARVVQLMRALGHVSLSVLEARAQRAKVHDPAVGAGPAQDRLSDAGP